ncbi:polysaccharide biosynthesis tyrosine autokinase [Niameybacter massiliensis]|uniref:polysaccharide biosynthesis tyrosine autokinase n=1 Tax=Niameybacter massiliensis TaxID=1658108 RepID=UPI0006B5CE9E|nr:polysaccharide biosynthesis tyrosine autokinase [Niameybacter massiliensis]
MPDPFNIEYKELLMSLLRKWYIVVLCILTVGGAMAYLKGGNIVTTYQTRTSIVVGNSIDAEGKSFNIQDIQVYQNYMNTYIAMLNTDMVMDKVVERLSFEASAGAIRGRISASPQANTQFLDLTLSWPVKEQAQEVLQVVTETFIEEMVDTYPAITLRMMDKVSEPSTITTGTTRSSMAIKGGMLGGILSIFVVFALEFMDNTLKSDKEVERRLNTCCLTRVPRQRKKIKTVSFRNVKEFSPSFLEAYRLLRTNLNFLSIDQNITSIVVTSAKQGDGKSLTTAMLATVMALAGKKTILVDCDLRKPSISNLFKFANERGFTDVLLNIKEVQDVVHQTSIDNLYVLPAGTVPINPSEILCSQKAKELIEGLKVEYDYMIIDSPPVGLMADGQVLSQYVDGCVLVASYRRTKIQEVEKAKAAIEYVDGKVLGVVLNRTKDKHMSKAYKNYAKEKDKERVAEIKKRNKAGVTLEEAEFDTNLGEVDQLQEGIELQEGVELQETRHLAVEGEAYDNNADGERLLL